MQKVRVGLLMMVMCASSFFVKGVSGEEHLKSSTGKVKVVRMADEIYNGIDFGDHKLSREVFAKAYLGYRNLRDAGKLSTERPLLSICDFSLSANVKRLWVIDMEKQKVLFHSLVAHGQGTGEEFARSFSNKENSHQSSLGFYVTESPYQGDNGYSLKLHGLDRGYNDAAYDRAVVMHGADYVSESYIKGNKRLGRSWGCPAVPKAMAKPIIDAIKNATCLYIYYPDKKYLASSTWLNKIPSASEEDLIREKFLQLSKEKTSSAPQNISMTANTNPNDAIEKLVQNNYQGVQLAVGR